MRHVSVDGKRHCLSISVEYGDEVSLTKTLATVCDVGVAVHLHAPG